MRDDHDLWTWVETACAHPARVLRLSHVQGDTFLIEEDGGASLSDGATLRRLLEQQPGRGSPHEVA
jgi:hypothetical protein